MITLILLLLANISLASNFSVISSFNSTSNYYGSIQPCKPCSLVWVHGYDADYNAAIRCFNQISTDYINAGGTCNIYGFAWNSKADAITSEDFKKKIKIADKVGLGSFSLFLSDFHSYCPNSKLSLLAHSLGSRIIFHPPNNGFTGIHNIISISAAINYDVLEKSNEFPLTTSNVNETYIAHNSDDIMVLGAAYEFTSGFVKALGLDGMKNSKKVSGSYEQLDFSDDWGDEHSAVYSSKLNSHFWKYYTPIISSIS